MNIYETTISIILSASIFLGVIGMASEPDCDESELVTINLVLLLGEARPSVLFASGQLLGYKLSDIPDTGKLYEAGVRDGDMITDVCGVAVSNLFADQQWTPICCPGADSGLVDVTFLNASGEQVVRSVPYTP